MDLSQATLHRDLRQFAVHILGNEVDAKEVVQEVFMACLERPPGQMSRSYLFKAVRNRSINQLRSRNRFFRLKEVFSQYLQILLLEDQGRNQNIVDLVQALPRKQSEVLLLRIKAELSIQEISQVLEIPQGTVKSRINKAIQSLKVKVKEIQL